MTSPFLHGAGYELANDVRLRDKAAANGRHSHHLLKNKNQVNLLPRRTY